MISIIFNVLQEVFTFVIGCIARLVAVKFITKLVIICLYVSVADETIS